MLAMTTTPDAPALSSSPAATQVSLPLRSVLPPVPVMAIAVVGATAATAITVIRPKSVPYSVQATSDYLVAITVGFHPFEALAVRWLANRRNLTPASRRKAQASTLTFGILSTVRVVRAIRRAPRR